MLGSEFKLPDVPDYDHLDPDLDVRIGLAVYVTQSEPLVDI